MDNDRQLKAGIVLTYVELVVQYAVSFITLPILIGFLGKSEYGLYNYVASVVAYLNILQAGISSAYVRFYTKAGKDRSGEKTSGINGTFMIVNVIISAIALILGLFLFFKSDVIFRGTLSAQQLAKCRPIVAVLVLNVIRSFLMSIFSSNVIAHERFIFQKTLVLFEVLLQPCIILPVAYLGYGAIGYSVATLVVMLIIDLINLVFCISKLDFRISFRNVSFSAVREVFSFTSFLVISYVVAQINWSVDKFLLGKMTGVIAVSVYQVAAQLKSHATKMAEAVSRVFTVRVNKLVFDDADSDTLTDLMIRVGRFQFCILLLISTGFALFGQKFIRLWVGDGYADAFYITLLLLVPTIIPSVQKIGYEILKAKNRLKVRSLVYLGIALFNVAASIPLCKEYGGIGCAIGTAASIVIGNGIFMNLYYWKAIRLDMPRFWGSMIKMLPAVLAAFLIGLLFVRLLGDVSLLLFILEILLYTLIYSVLMWLFGLNAAEKYKLLHLLERKSSD